MSNGAYGIRQVRPDTPGAIICATCHRAWLEDITPSGRCPWEAEHNDGAELYEPQRPVHHVEAKVIFADGTEAHVLVAEGTDMAWGARTEYLADTLDLRAAIRDVFHGGWDQS